jgi:hypothetical protein
MALTLGAAQAQVLGTWGTPSTAWYGGVMFDATASGSQAIALTGAFNLNINGTVSDTYDVWYRAGSYTASPNSEAGWTLLGTGTATGAGQNNKTLLNVGNSLVINPGETYGIAIFVNATLSGMTASSSIGYSSGAQTVSDSNLTLSLGAAKAFNLTGPNDFEGTTFMPRTWQGEVFYAPVPEPATLAALGLGVGVLLRRRRR